MLRDYFQANHFLSEKIIQFKKWIGNWKTEPNIKAEKIISKLWKLLSNCFMTKIKLKVAVLSFFGSPYLYKQEFSATNGIKSDLRTALQVKECWLKCLHKMISKQVDCWRHQCSLQNFKLVSIFWQKFGPKWKKLLQPPIFSANLTALLIIYPSIHPSIHPSGLVTAVAVFRNPNTIPFCLTTDLLLNVLFSWLLLHLPSTFFLDVLFFFFPLVLTNPQKTVKSYMKKCAVILTAMNSAMGRYL